MIHGLTGLTCLPHARLINSDADAMAEIHRTSPVESPPPKDARTHPHINMGNVSKLRTQKNSRNDRSAIYFNMYHSGLLFIFNGMGDIKSLGAPDTLDLQQPRGTFRLGSTPGLCRTGLGGLAPCTGSLEDTPWPMVCDKTLRTKHSPKYKVRLASACKKQFWWTIFQSQRLRKSV